MQISVLIPSRGRPAMLQEAVASLHERASGKHEVAYIVGCDDDDPSTAATAQNLGERGLPVQLHRAPRQPSLGGLVNTMALTAPADVYCSLCDDVVCLTEGWDDKIAQAWQAQPDGVWWWHNNADATYAIVSEKWRAAAGRIFTDYFPFWWDDCWLIQLWMYVTGEPLLFAGVDLEDKSPATQRMRDLEFWTAFYWSRRIERWKEGRRIAAALGRPQIKASPFNELMPNEEFNRRIPSVEAWQGDKTPPTPGYLAAKARAEALMPNFKPSTPQGASMSASDLQPNPQDVLDAVIGQRNAFMNEVAASQALIKRLRDELAAAHTRVADLEKAAPAEKKRKAG